ncbi:MAG: septal ring lytic transglycosylase RlpA family protein, partial [Thermodesulfobacteriota bacterium]
KKYTTIDSSQNFSQKGIASWYGKKFHGRKTANGETYNMHDMTCAHKTLPFNTKLEVKNLSNGKKTVVRVNDRGPFVNKRIIDLSYKAAGKLGIDITGTAPVVIKAIDGLTKKEYLSGKFTVQIGSFTSRANAERLKKKLSSDFNHIFIQKFRKDNKTFFRVRAGKFKSLKQAEVTELKLRQNGYPNAFSVALD